MIPRLVIAGFLLGHALIHGGFISRRPPGAPGAPPWPFDLGHSWLLDRLGAGPGANRLVGSALVAATIGGFALGALATLGIVPAVLWPAGVAIGAVASLGVLVLFFHPWLLLGVAIDVLLLWAALGAGWNPDSLSG
jgi:sterol desaturase/sphingolipid hydroxylase (fatty acid hydroxylase superfamily)